MQIISSPKTLNVILESGFIQNVLFKSATYSTKFDPKRNFDSVVIYVELYELSLELINQMKSSGKKIVLYHMGDELADKDISAYTSCDLIIRNYFFPEIIHRQEFAHKILWAPNGYKTGVGPRAENSLQKTLSRQYLSCFLGWLSNTASFNGERSLFSEAVAAWGGNQRRRAKNVRNWIQHYLSLSKEYLSFTRVAPALSSDLHLLSSNGFSSGYNVGLYSATMEDSIFSPCPAGNSPETIRLYDALECGCIPVCLEHGFISSPLALGGLGKPPFCFLQSWEEFPELLCQMKRKMISHPEEIQKMQDDCITWWADYKKYIAQKITLRIEGLS